MALPITTKGQLTYKVKFLIKIHPDLAEDIRVLYQIFLNEMEDNKEAIEKDEIKEVYEAIQGLLLFKGKIKKA